MLWGLLCILPRPALFLERQRPQKVLICKGMVPLEELSHDSSSRRWESTQVYALQAHQTDCQSVEVSVASQEWAVAGKLPASLQVIPQSATFSTPSSSSHLTSSQSSLWQSGSLPVTLPLYCQQRCLALQMLVLKSWRAQAALPVPASCALWPAWWTQRKSQNLL